MSWYTADGLLVSITKMVCLFLRVSLRNLKHRENQERALLKFQSRHECLILSADGGWECVMAGLHQDLQTGTYCLWSVSEKSENGMKQNMKLHKRSNECVIIIFSVKKKYSKRAEATNRNFEIKKENWQRRFHLEEEMWVLRCLLVCCLNAAAVRTRGLEAHQCSLAHLCLKRLDTDVSPKTQSYRTKTEVCFSWLSTVS